METYLRNVNPEATETDVTLAFVNVLHRPPFRVPSDPPMNFHVTLFKKGRSKTHSGRGRLTLPTEKAGELLLSLFPSVTVKGGAIQVLRSPRDISQWRTTLLRIRSSQWEDPSTLQQEKQRMVEGSQPIPLFSFAFGRLCRDHVFSPEVVHSGPSTVALDMEQRRLTLDFCNSTKSPIGSPTNRPLSPSTNSSSSLFDLDFSALDLFSTKETVSVYFQASAIAALAAAGREIATSSDHIGVYVEAKRPPIFQLQKESGFEPFNILNNSVPPPPQRLSSLGDHPAMEYVGQGLYLWFNTTNEFQTFQARCAQLHLPRFLKKYIPAEERDLYSEEPMRDLDDTLKLLDFQIAFEAERAVFNGLLEPNEIVELKPHITRLKNVYESEFSDIFRVFTAGLEAPRLGIDPRHRRRRRRHHVNGPQAVNRSPVVSQLEEAVGVYVAQLQRPRHRLLLLASSSSAASQSFHLGITPSTKILEGPLPDQGNSVLRRFGHNESFLRVSFEDEDRCKIRNGSDLDISDMLRKRFRLLLVEGLHLAGRDYEFLSYSMSGLREHSVWFVIPFLDNRGVLMNAEQIRKDLGDFENNAYKPARLGARWAQSFSTSDPSVILKDENIRKIPDRISPSGSNFTDGSGTISLELSREVWSRIRRSQGTLSGLPRIPPSCIQYRTEGYKGVLVVDSRLDGKVVCLRPSQKKFDGPGAWTLDITGTSSRPIAMFLNRPLIMLLEHHGVDGDYLLQLQEAATTNVHKIFESFQEASTLFDQHGLGASYRLPSLFRNLGSHLSLVPWSSSMIDGLQHQLIDVCLSYGATHVLREIKYRARIPVPGSVTLLGVPDEWDCLEEDEVYATVYDDRKGIERHIEGEVLITRSPQIHPGDLQIVHAVRRPELEHLRNVVVFSCKGNRSLPSCLAGGDLDGDIYNLILDPNLIPERVSDPGSYESLGDKTLDRRCTVEDVADFIIDYIVSDLLGYISILHLRLADLGTAGDPKCIELAVHASHAVDFPKTGKPVSFKDLPRAPAQEKPDFLSYEGTDTTRSPSYYPSPKILGKLFRNVPMTVNPPDIEYEEPTHGSKILSTLPTFETPSEELQQTMDDLLEAYRDQLLEIAYANSVSPHTRLSEGELVSGTIQSRWNDQHKRREAITVMNFQTHELVKIIRRGLRGNPQGHHDIAHVHDDAQDGDEVDEVHEVDEDDDESSQETLRRAYAAWTTAEKAINEEPKGFGIQSFGLIALGTLLEELNPSHRFPRHH